VSEVGQRSAKERKVRRREVRNEMKNENPEASALKRTPKWISQKIKRVEPQGIHESTVWSRHQVEFLFPFFFLKDEISRRDFLFFFFFFFFFFLKNWKLKEPLPFMRGDEVSQSINFKNSPALGSKREIEGEKKEREGTKRWTFLIGQIPLSKIRTRDFLWLRQKHKNTETKKTEKNFKSPSFHFLSFHFLSFSSFWSKANPHQPAFVLKHTHTHS